MSARSGRLAADRLAGLPVGVRRPGFERDQISTGVVHLGAGAFHRAHQVPVFEAALEGGDPRWGVMGVSMRSADVHERLVPQDGLYSLREGGSQIRVMGAVTRLLVAPDDPRAVVRAMADPAVHLVTLTVTEKGYDPDPRGEPRWTAPALIAAALASRRRAGSAPFTAISCDNLPANGALLRERVLAAADSADVAWIEAEAAFPSTVVDRIVPAATAAVREAAARDLGVRDEGAIASEEYWQWVIEDSFAGPSPPFEALGVRLVSDVSPWAAAKLRMLNAAHSTMSYLGGLAGLSHVHEVIGRRGGRRVVRSLWDEAATTISSADGLDLEEYRSVLEKRFADAALPHSLAQIAEDGSYKLPARLVGPIVDRRRRGVSSPALVLTVAAWMRWQSGVDDRGRAIRVVDPRAASTARALVGCGSARERAAALLSMEDVFPAELASDRSFVTDLGDALARLESGGASVELA